MNQTQCKVDLQKVKVLNICVISAVVSIYFVTTGFLCVDFRKFFKTVWQRRSETNS